MYYFTIIEIIMMVLAAEKKFEIIQSSPHFLSRHSLVIKKRYLYMKVLRITKTCLSNIISNVASSRNPSCEFPKEISRSDSYLDFMRISHNLQRVGLYLDTFRPET